MKIVKPQKYACNTPNHREIDCWQGALRIAPRDNFRYTQLWSLQWWSVRLLNIPRSAASGS